MKKLKGWQIVLLVIFYPIGLCVLAYRLWKKHKLKQTAENLEAERKAAENARREAREKERAEKEARRAARAAYLAALHREDFRVVGVTYRNSGRGGRNRQTILRAIDNDCPDAGALSLRQMEYEGEAAVGVFYGNEQCGFISREDLPELLPLMPRYDCIGEYWILGGGRNCNYGLEIAAYFKKD